MGTRSFRTDTGAADTPSETQIRVALLARLAAADPGALLVEELGLANASLSVNRIDVAAASDLLRGFEIKSAVDTLVRLPAQAAAYDAVFAQLSLIGDREHLDRAAAIVGPHWGLVEAARGDGEEVIFAERRAPTLNQRRDPDILVRLLWRDEALALATSLGLGDGLARARRRMIWDRLVAHLSTDELEAALIAAMRTRTNWRTTRESLRLGDSDPSHVGGCG